MGRHDGDSIRVLVVDDQRTMRSIIRQLLGSVGINRVSEAENGEQALALMRAPMASSLLSMHSMMVLVASSVASTMASSCLPVLSK